MSNIYDSAVETQDHIKKVRELLDLIVVQLLLRGNVHDRSKLHEPEKSVFDRFTPMLRETDYMSETYKKYLHEMKPALEHHYQENSHHPEHYQPAESRDADILAEYLHKSGMPKEVRVIIEAYIEELRSPINNMSLLDLVEMLADWVASSKRHANGNPERSIRLNRDRFKISEQLTRILLNTLTVWNS